MLCTIALLHPFVLLTWLVMLAVTVATLTDLGFLWFREFYLESSRVIQVILITYWRLPHGYLNFKVYIVTKNS